MQEEEEGNGGSLVDVLFNIASEVVASRVRMRALLEILEEKGIVSSEAFDQRGQEVWDRDWESIAEEVAPEILLAPGEE